MLALALIVAVISTGALAPASAVGSDAAHGSAKIETLAAHAYVWGSPAEFVYRFGTTARW
jgi:hypothetical protein